MKEKEFDRIVRELERGKKELVKRGTGERSRKNTSITMTQC